MSLIDSAIGSAAARRASKPTGRADVTGARTAGKHVPRTQDEVLVAATRDNCLILRDYSVVAAVGVGSIDDTLLSASEAQAKRQTFRELLKQLRFDVQLLIGTRPQNLRDYRDRLEARLDELDAQIAELRVFQARVPGFLARLAQTHASNVETFTAHFGFVPDSLRGLPGTVSLAVRWLLNPDLPRQVAAMDAGKRQAFADLIVAQAQSSIDFLRHWQRIIFERDAFLDETLREHFAPVRTFLLVTAFNPRLIVRSVKRGALSEDEFAKARDVLGDRCDFLLHRISRMGLPVWRASSEELLRDVSLFYHPSFEELSQRDLRLDRSLATQRAAAAAPISQ